ncbi:MAG: bifunctional 5,10-methylenetetrahydrofolate dehydrogenase/5,10-methenyltetrahydrofolate cyclohydrolase, partial [bacterium]
LYSYTMSLTLDGKKIRETRLPTLKAEFLTLPSVPTLAIVQVGDRADSNSYINQKKIFGEKIGVKTWHLKFTEDVGQEKVIEEIKNLNLDPEIQGIIAQLPLPEGWDKKSVINSIAPEKDVDGLTAVNQEKFYAGDASAFVPATARGVMTMLDFYNISITGKKAVVVGRSELVGKPIAQLLKMRGAEVEVCHRQTLDVPAVTRTADVLVVAAGNPKMIKVDFVKERSVVVDVGINKTLDGVLCGDVDFENVKDKVQAISPVPGGVGPLTVLSLFENLLLASKK